MIKEEITTNLSCIESVLSLSKSNINNACSNLNTD